MQGLKRLTSQIYKNYSRLGRDPENELRPIRIVGAGLQQLGCPFCCLTKSIKVLSSSSPSTIIFDQYACELLCHQESWTLFVWELRQPDDFVSCKFTGLCGFVAACPPGCNCQADFSCVVDVYGAIVCNSGYVSTGATCVGMISQLSVVVLLVYSFFGFADITMECTEQRTGYHVRHKRGLRNCFDFTVI